MKPHPSPLEIATSARVACARLDELLERGHHQKAAVINRDLWTRIEAMATCIEDLQAEVERLQKIGTATVYIPDLPAPAFVEGTICEAPATVTLGERPPGFDRVRRTLRHQPLHRENPCATIVLPEDRPLPPKKKAMRVIDWKNGAQRSSAPPWQRVVSAYLDGQLLAGETYSKGALRRICGLSSNVLEGVQMDLAEHRAPVRLIDRGNSVYVRAA